MDIGIEELLIKMEFFPKKYIVKFRDKMAQVSQSSSASLD